MDTLPDCGGLLASAAEDAERAKTRRRVRHPEWFKNYARLEAEAVELRCFANQAVPGLFQTPHYARAAFASRQPFFDEETIEPRSSSVCPRGWLGGS